MTKKLIQTYSKTWIDDFRSIRYIINEQISDKKFVIEHIGSTSVPGLDAKPIIDIDIVYQKDSDFGILKEKLELLGYYHNGNFGIAGREVFKRNGKKTAHNVLDVVTHHLYACRFDNIELRRHILFRNWLREDILARDAYAKLKYEIAKEANQDQKAYAQIKEVKAKEFVEGVIMKAEESYSDESPKLLP